MDNTLFYSQVPDKLQGSHKLLEAHIEAFRDFAIKEADMLQKYREKRSQCVKQALKDGYTATSASDVAKGDSAADKAEWLKAVGDKQQCKYNIQAVQDRIYTIRHLSSQIEHQMKV